MKKYIIPILTIFCSLLLSIFFFDKLPESMASHWNAQGLVDGYSTRMFNVIFFPLLQIFLLLLLIAVPKIDPEKKSIKRFESTYLLFISAILIFLSLLQLQVFLWNTGIKIPMQIVVPILMGGLFIVTGQVIGKARQNFTIGIRTPWTLSSEKVWDRTHALGGKLFTLSGILSIFSALLPPYSIYVVLISILLSTVILFIYSYLEYRKEG